MTLSCFGIAPPRTHAVHACCEAGVVQYATTRLTKEEEEKESHSSSRGEGSDIKILKPAILQVKGARIPMPMHRMTSLKDSPC